MFNMASSGTLLISFHVFSRNEELYISKELNKNVLASEGKSHRPETMTTILPQKINMLAMTSQFWMSGKIKNFAQSKLTLQGPVVWMLVSAKPGLNFNPCFFFFLSKALSQIIFSIFFSTSNHQIVGKENSTELAV